MRYPSPREALARAVEIAGGQKALASAIGKGVTQSHVWNWLNRENARVPAEYCPNIEWITRREVICEELRPDVDWEYLRMVAAGPTPEVVEQSAA